MERLEALQGAADVFAYPGTSAQAVVQGASAAEADLGTGVHCVGIDSLGCRQVASWGASVTGSHRGTVVRTSDAVAG